MRHAVLLWCFVVSAGLALVMGGCSPKQATPPSSPPGPVAPGPAANSPLVGTPVTIASGAPTGKPTGMPSPAGVQTPSPAGSKSPAVSGTPAAGTPGNPAPAASPSATTEPVPDYKALEGKKDPFAPVVVVPKEKESVAGEQPVARPDDPTAGLTLVGVLGTAGDFAAMIQEGAPGSGATLTHVVKAGDTVGPLKVKSIGPKQAVLTLKGKEYKLPLQQPTFPGAGASQSPSGKTP